MPESANFLSIVANAVALFVCMLFLSAGWNKVKAENQRYYIQVFSGYMLTLGGLPAPLLKLLPRLTGAIEILIAVAVIFPVTQGIGLVMAAGMLSVYVIAMAMQLQQGKSGSDCGCSGSGGKVKIRPMLVSRNLILIAFVILAIAFSGNATANWFAVSWLISAPLAFVLGLIYLSAEQLIENNQVIEAINESNL